MACDRKMPVEELVERIPGGIIKGNAVWTYSLDAPEIPYQDPTQSQAVSTYRGNYVNYGGSREYANATQGEK